MTVTQNAWRQAARRGVRKGQGPNGELSEVAGPDEVREFES